MSLLGCASVKATHVLTLEHACKAVVAPILRRKACPVLSSRHCGHLLRLRWGPQLRRRLRAEVGRRKEGGGLRQDVNASHKSPHHDIYLYILSCYIYSFYNVYPIPIELNASEALRVSLNPCRVLAELCIGSRALRLEHHAAASCAGLVVASLEVSSRSLWCPGRARPSRRPSAGHGESTKSTSRLKIKRKLSVCCAVLCSAVLCRIAWQKHPARPWRTRHQLGLKRLQGLGDDEKHMNP